MSAANSICRRCHRLRPVNGARYCATCSAELRAAERRRPASAPVVADLTPSLAPVKQEAVPEVERPTESLTVPATVPERQSRDSDPPYSPVNDGETQSDDEQTSFEMHDELEAGQVTVSEIVAD